jgi:hypothetical protein
MEIWVTFDGAFITSLSLSLSLSLRYRRDYCSVTISDEEQWESTKKNCTILDARRNIRRLI